MLSDIKQWIQEATQAQKRCLAQCILLELRDGEETTTKQTETRKAQWNKKHKQNQTNTKKKTQKKMPPKNEKNREHQKTGKPQQTIATARTSSVAQKISLCKLCSSWLDYCAASCIKPSRIKTYLCLSTSVTCSGKTIGKCPQFSSVLPKNLLFSLQTRVWQTLIWINEEHFLQTYNHLIVS